VWACSWVSEELHDTLNEGRDVIDP
jgi:hypothetical protein